VSGRLVNSVMARARGSGNFFVQEAHSPWLYSSIADLPVAKLSR
jgi:hypothetical protein